LSLNVDEVQKIISAGKRQAESCHTGSHRPVPKKQAPESRPELPAFWAACNCGDYGVGNASSDCYRSDVAVSWMSAGLAGRLLWGGLRDINSGLIVSIGTRKSETERHGEQRCWYFHEKQASGFSLETMWPSRL